MRNVKFILAATTVLLATFFISCEKEEEQIDLTQNVVGTYEGKLINSDTNLQISSTSIVTRSNDYTVQIHCYGTDFDTTFMLELYPDGNVMRVCTSGENFNRQYGHQKSGNHNMMDDGGWMNWNEHMSNDHQSSDQHYGNFNPDNNLFDYTFNMQSDTNSYTRHFIGNR